MKNAFTIDVEDYYQVEAFADIVDKTRWSQYESRVRENTETVLGMLDECHTRATFFVLGWVAKRHPELVKMIAECGHEIASHGMSHKLIYTQTPEEFRQETRDSKTLLEDLAQKPVTGYRAATYSITSKSLWAMDIIAEAGFLYDSSIFPIRHDKYGIPDAKRTPYRHETSNGNTIVEFPISVLELGPLKIPVAGGGYFRLFPYPFSSWALTRLNANARPFVFYIHPWEIDPAQPKMRHARLLSRFRHYLNLDKCAARLRRLLRDFSFTTMNQVLDDQGLLPVKARGGGRITGDSPAHHSLGDTG